MLIKNLYVNPRFYYLFLAVIFLSILSFVLPVLYLGVWIALGLILGATIWDFTVLFILNPNGFNATRILPKRFSNGDHNPIEIRLENKYNSQVYCRVIDEIPFEFQIRDFQLKASLKAHSSRTLVHHLRPTTRGLYEFGALRVYVSTKWNLVSRAYVYPLDQSIKCYPSFIQMKELELVSFTKAKMNLGFKRIRRLGHTQEFEQIKNYVSGDDIRSINWKATAKNNQLMVNQFSDQTRQSICLMIDTGRVMQMPFNGLSLLDHAINASLALSNVILKKSDKVSLTTYAEKVKSLTLLSAEPTQVQRIMEMLYSIQTRFLEPDYGKLYSHVKHNITHRSLLILFTNFETKQALHRQLPYLRAIAKQHVLVVVFFENAELQVLTQAKATHTQDIFDKVIASDFAYQKKLIAKELDQYGIHSVLTSVEQLGIDTINKYLEIKARGIL